MDGEVAAERTKTLNRRCDGCFAFPGGGRAEACTKLAAREVSEIKSILSTFASAPAGFFIGGSPLCLVATGPRLNRPRRSAALRKGGAAVGWQGPFLRQFPHVDCTGLHGVGLTPGTIPRCRHARLVRSGAAAPFRRAPPRLDNMSCQVPGTIEQS